MSNTFNHYHWLKSEIIRQETDIREYPFLGKVMSKYLYLGGLYFRGAYIKGFSYEYQSLETLYMVSTIWNDISTVLLVVDIMT